MPRTALLAIAAVTGALALGSATAAMTPEVRFATAGDTYDPASIAVMSDWEGARNIVNRAPAGGITLTAAATEIHELVYRGAGVGVLPLLAASVTGVEASCDPSTTVPIIARNPKWMARPRKNGLWSTVKWRAVGCTSDAAGNQFPVADGTTKWTVAKYRWVYRKQITRKIWNSDFDEYYNTCISSLRDVRASGGRLYCTEVVRSGLDRVTYRLTQKTTITKRYPAYVTPPGHPHAWRR